MSINVDYFFNYQGALGDVVDTLRRILGCNFVGADNDRYFVASLLSIELTVLEHDLSNDRECDFENYPYQLGSYTSAGDADLRTIQIPIMAQIAYLLYKRGGVSNGLLVYDIQFPLARYAVQNDQWTDLVSMNIVEYPNHLLHVVKKTSIGS